MRFALLVHPLTVASLVTFATLASSLVGCSSNTGTSTSSTTKREAVPDAAVTVPAPLPAPGPVSVAVQGHGHVMTEDGSFDCGESGGLDGGTCTMPHYALIFGVPYPGWIFDHWEPSMSTDTSMQVESWSASPITAVFVRLPNNDGGYTGPATTAGDD